MGWREILGVPADQPPRGRHEGYQGRGYRREDRHYTDDVYPGDQRPIPDRATERVFRPGDVDESPDQGPTSHGVLDEASPGRPETRPADAGEPGRTGLPAEPAAGAPLTKPAAEPSRTAEPAQAAGATPADEPADAGRPAPGWRGSPPAERVIAPAAGGAQLAWRFPPQQVVASYETHGQAVRAVDYLADRRFPVERTAIVGRGLTSVESIGRMSWRDSTLRTVGTWAVAGAVFGLVIGLLDWASPLRAAFSLALWGLLIGAVLGLLGGLLVRAFAGGGHPDRVTRTRAYRADSYDLLVDTEVADRARSLLVLAGFPVTGAIRQDAAASGGLRVGHPGEPGRTGARRP